jgi:beta-lactamase superfamily II metal-dependent hydrolase
MAGVTRVAILFCGQGMATLIEYYKNGNVSSTPDNLVLIDFGGNQKYSEEAAQYVVARLKKQKKPKFDLVVISHQDGDHLSLLSALTDAIDEAGITATCDNSYAGGTAWSAANKKKVKTFFADAMDDSDDPAFDAPYESNYTGAKTRAELGELASFASTYVRVLVSGLKLSKGPQDIIRNASSAVIIVENGDWSMVLPGDATYHTMAEVNNFYKKWKTKPLVPRVFALEIPHHGALRTAVENYTAKTAFSDLDMTIITNFAKYMAPKHVVASAGPFNTHNHPILEVMDIFDNKNIATVGKHTFVAYVFDRKKSKKSDGWDQFETTKGLQTTVNQIEGSTLWGNVYYDFNDPGAALGREAPTITFEAMGTIEGLIQSYGAEAASDPWLQELMAAARKAPPETILRAPPPDAGPDDAP